MIVCGETTRLSQTQKRVYRHINMKGEVEYGEIYDSMGYYHSTLHDCVERLEDKNLVERISSDSHGVGATYTTTGCEVYDTSPTEDMVYEYIKEKGKVRTVEMIEEFDNNESTIRSALSTLNQLDIISSKRYLEDPRQLVYYIEENNE